jgi:hypothetical protein
LSKPLPSLWAKPAHDLSLDWHRVANRQEIIDRLRQNEAALRALGVSRAALFG